MSYTFRRYFVEHFTYHVQYNNINFVRINNCPYCKRDRRQNYHNNFRMDLENDNTDRIIREYDQIRNENTPDIPNNTEERQLDRIRQRIRLNIQNNNQDRRLRTERNNREDIRIRNRERNRERNRISIRESNREHNRIRNRDRNRERARRINRRQQRDIQYHINQEVEQHRSEQRTSRRELVVRGHQVNPLNLRYERLVDLEDVVVKSTLENINKHSTIKVNDNHDHYRCVVCLNDITTNHIVRKIKCGHSFHIDCIDTWLEKNDTCPICKYKLS